MQPSLRITGTLLSACVSLVAAGCGRGEDGTITLRLGHASLTGKPLYAAFETFKQQAEQRSGGRLRIEVYPQGALGDARLLLESVVLGTLDLTADSPLSTYVPEMGLLDLPYFFYDSRHAAENLDGEFGRALAARAEPRGVVVLGYFGNGSRYIFNRVRDVRTPEDLSGLRIRVPEGRVWIEMMNRFGALATPLSWGEVFTGIEQGVIDGAESDPISIYRAGFHEICQHLSRTEHIYNVCPLIIHRRRFLALPEDLRAVLYQAAHAAAVENRRQLEANFDQACRSMEEKGVVIVDVDRRRFQERVRLMRDQYVRELSAQDLVEKLTAPPQVE